MLNRLLNFSMWVLLGLRFLCKTSDTMLSEPKIGPSLFGGDHCHPATREVPPRGKHREWNDALLHMLRSKPLRLRHTFPLQSWDCLCLPACPGPRDIPYVGPQT